MKCKGKLIFFLVLFSGNFRFAQAQKINNYSFSLLNNAVSMPFSGKAGIVHSPLHPGFQGGVGLMLRERQTFEWTQQAYAGYIYQRVIHHLANVYTENQANWKFYKGLWGGAGLGAGYVHLINTRDNKVYKLNSEGEYERTLRWGQPKFMASFSMALSYRIISEKATFSPFVRYQFWMLAPFVKSYVPLLPNATLHVGIYYSPSKS
jgi:hypothetical protein